MESNGRIGILVVENERMMRDGLRTLFAKQSDMRLVGESESLTDALPSINEWRPDVLVIDITSLTNGTATAVKQIAERYPPARVVALSPLSNRAFVAEVLQAGVHGYVVKDDPFDELLEAVRAVVSGSTYLGSSARRVIVEQYAQGISQTEMSLEARLKDRERKVLRLLAEGRSSKEIAMTLDLSSKTIDACRRQLMRKLHVDSVAGLVKYAILMGITTLLPDPPQLTLSPPR